MSLLDKLWEIVERRRSQDLLRKLTLPPSPDAIDFSSNDYLGYAQDYKLVQGELDSLLVPSDLHAEIGDAHSKPYIDSPPSRNETSGSHGCCDTEGKLSSVSASTQMFGSTGSRLLTGNSEDAQRLEDFLAKFHNQESALLFNSGFDLNLGLFASVPQPGDFVVFDELVHNSIREGLKLSRGTSVPFAHNDCDDLRRVLQEIDEARKSKNANIIISVESVYSMDGHTAPLVQICRIAKEFGANVIVDEAHGTGVFGPGGRGVIAEFGLSNKIFCAVHTFGKALACHGAVVVGPQILRDYLINYARPLIYSTSLPLHSIHAIYASYRVMERTCEARQAHLRNLVERFKVRLQQLPKGCALTSNSPIQGIIVPGNDAVMKFGNALREQNMLVLPIRSPTVPKGTERLRIILHYHNSIAEVDALMDMLVELFRKSDAISEGNPSASISDVTTSPPHSKSRI